MKSGIYKITNLVDGKIYIGLTKDVKSRFRHHRYYLNHNIHSNPYLQKAWKKHGKENFVFEVIEYCKEDELAKQENYWCRLLGADKRKTGYNLRSTSDSTTFNHSQETLKKMSESKKGEKNSFYGKKHSTDVKNKMSKVKLGKKMPDSMREKRKNYQLAIKWKPSNLMIENAKKSHYRPIVQLSKTGEYIKEFNGPADALRELNLSMQNGHITTTCKGRRLMCGGYSWMYKEDYLDPEKLKDRISKLRVAVIHKT